MQGVVALACHPLAPMVYTGCLDGVLRAWDIRTGAALVMLLPSMLCHLLHCWKCVAVHRLETFCERPSGVVDAQFTDAQGAVCGNGLAIQRAYKR